MQVTDLTLARENQTSFEEYLSEAATSNPGIDLTVTVLTTGFWPSYKSSDLALPAEMVCIIVIASLLFYWAKVCVCKHLHYVRKMTTRLTYHWIFDASPHLQWKEW
jgi:hypothetical protein